VAAVAVGCCGLIAQENWGDVKSVRGGAVGVLQSLLRPVAGFIGLGDLEHVGEAGVGKCSNTDLLLSSRDERTTQTARVTVRLRS